MTQKSAYLFALQASAAVVRASASPAPARTSRRLVASPALLKSSSISPTSPPAAASGLFLCQRCGYATQHQKTSSSSTSRRRAVTPFNDDGRVPWKDLSIGEKTGRAAQQTFNFGLVIVGVVLTGGVSYFLYTEVFSPNSKVSNFNRAVDRIRADRQCTDLLGDSKNITAFGEATWNKWQRARPIASTIRTDAQGNEHLLMSFHVKGSRNQGTASLHMVKRVNQSDFTYKYFYLDVPGHERISLEQSQESDHPGDKKTTLFGIKWS